MENDSQKKSYGNYGYKKKPLWQWILLYVIIGAVVYGAIYYLFLGRKGGYKYIPNSPNQNYKTP